MIETRSKRLWSKHNFPNELWPEIFSRLPAKSLLRFCSVSKLWRALIDNPTFPRSHLTTFNNNRDESHLFVLQRGNTQSECVVRCSLTFRPTARLGRLNNFDFLVDNLQHFMRWYVVGSADGVYMLKRLVFVFQYDNGESLPGSIIESPGAELMLWNPSIRKVRMLPPPPTPPNHSLNGIDVGIGFDPSINDYKFVRFWIADKRTLVSIAIYTFGTNSWKEISFEEISFEGDWCWDTCRLIWSPRSVCFRGVLYFISRNLVSESFEVVSFHLSSEELASGGLPVDKDINYESNIIDPVLTLVDGGSSVAVILMKDNKGSIWVWDGIGGDTTVHMAWRKRYTFASRISEEYPEYDGAINFVYLKCNGEMIIQWFSSLVSYYNLETHMEKVVLENKGVSMNIRGLFVHVESLMLLN